MGTTSIVLANHVLHRSLCLEEERTADTDGFLSDVLYLGMLLESIVLHNRLVVAEHPNFDVQRAYREGVFVNERESLLSTRLANDPLLGKLLESGAITFHTPNVEADRDAHVDVIGELQASGFDDDAYVAEAVLDYRLAQSNHYFIHS